MLGPTLVPPNVVPVPFMRSVVWNLILQPVVAVRRLFEFGKFRCTEIPFAPDVYIAKPPIFNALKSVVVAVP